MIEWIVVSSMIGASISGRAVWYYHHNYKEKSEKEKRKLEKEVRELEKRMTTERERVLRYVSELVENVPRWKSISPSCYEMKLHGYTYQIEKQKKNYRIHITIKREDIVIIKVKYQEVVGRIHMILLETEGTESGDTSEMIVQNPELRKAVGEIEKHFPVHQESIYMQPTIKKEKVEKEPISSSIPELEKTKRMLSYIKKCREWFTEEELFCVEELWENDIKKMKRVYEEVSEQNKEEAKEVFVKGLLVLKKKVEELVQTGDMRKMKEIKKQVRVVEERDV